MSWDSLHTHYQKQPWVQGPSIFAQEVIHFFPGSGKILEIGAGLGQDSRFFYSHGYEMYSTDFSEYAVDLNKNLSQKEIDSGRYFAYILDLLGDSSFGGDDFFDGIYAHLSLHYFSKQELSNILSKLHKVLKSGGVVAFLMNSCDDPEYKKGTYLEDDFFLIEGVKKRFFTPQSAEEVLSPYFIKNICDNLGETYKDSEKGIHNLIRYIGTK